ncbi:MAG TPA: TolC family protein [Nitrospirae bacterium]|nr:TolC family protein [Nitrospirota bacterium]
MIFYGINSCKRLSGTVLPLLLLVHAFFLFVLPSNALALTLEEGLKIVAEQGRDIKISEAEEDVVREGVQLARSPLLPQVDLYANQTLLSYQPEAVFGPFESVPISEKDFLTYGFRVNQLVYDFGGTSSMLRVARLGLKEKKLDTLRVRNLVALNFTLAYLDLLETEKFLRVAQNEVKRFEAHLNDTRAMYEEGLITKNDFLEAEVMLSDARQKLLTTENLRAMRASRINSLLVRPLNEEVNPEEISVKPYTKMTLEAAWKSAVRLRPELKGIQTRIRAKKEELKATKASFYPNIYVSGGYEYQENSYMVHEGNWSFLAGVKVNLFSGGATRARIRKVGAELRSLTLTEEKLRDGIMLEVKKAYLQLRSAGKKVGVTNEAVAQAGENLRLQRIRYHEGVGTATDVIDAVTLMSRAETNYWSAVYSLKRAEAGLLHAMGEDITRGYGKSSS